MTPPSSPPPQMPPTLIPPGSNGKPKSFTPLIVGVVILAGVAGGVFATLPKLAKNVLPSGMTTNGKSLSRADAQEGIKEMVELTRGARAGDPSTLNTSFEPKTELGKNFKAVALKSQAVEATYAKALGGKTVADLLAAPNLTSAPARAKTRERLNEIKAASIKYFADTGTVSQELFRVIAGANGDRIPQAPALEAEIRQNSEAMTTLLGTVGKMLDFTDEAKPTLVGGSATFRTSAQVSRFNALVQEYNANAESLQRVSAAALQERQRNMSEAVRKIDGGSLGS